ncbi:T9SS C-terminal target domain-containing protein [Chryseotalea sanaruensis]|uniref:T9SS C-terminal target domain-containing protein n=1 Tax=Chryseotalea sanaruensis TaxID=2482724 RepID=A0A401UCN6_9BACT|nr:T9SS type A sorting domain-containing protein [Chryseotalea sanaruensis]GCC52640.1 T9SS C-terminal target domain-containing protein [Chryseotalea sanaruensis]
MRFIALLLIVSTTAWGQYAYEADFSIPVRTVDDQLLAQPWAGGINAVQVNTLDINNDGVEDLILFDRTANKVLTYLVQNQQYNYAPAYETLFPNDLANFLLLRDFNGDGKKDIFTGNPFGIKVYLNNSSGDMLSWQHLLFQNSNVLLTTGFSGKTNIQLQADDVPTIADMDGDGDLDVLCMNFSGSGKIEYHKNVGTLNSPDFVRTTQSWGGLTECGCGAFAFNNTTCVSNGRIQHAGGKFLLALDVNADNQMDLIFSESECDQLYLFINEGTSENAVFTQAAIFPDNLKENGLYPIAFYEDLDFDNIKDLIISPGVFERSDDVTDFSQSLYFHKNMLSNNNPQFAASLNFLQNEMIDLGENACPAFFDYDGDGDDDLFIGVFGIQQDAVFRAALSLYENTGDQHPSFKFVTNDYANLSTYKLYNLKPQFTDINRDGITDLVFTATNQDGQTLLHYILNNSSTALSLQNTITETSFTVFFNENIHISDINNDGLPDALVGKANGAVEYWKNNGSAQLPSWQRESTAFLDIDQSFVRQNPSILISDTNNDAKQDLIIGLQDGTIQILSDFNTAVSFDNAEKELTFNPLSRQFEVRNFGGPVWTSSFSTTSQNYLVIGNHLGGLQLLKAKTPENNFSVFPNPASKNQSIFIESTTAGVVQIYSAQGQFISSANALKGTSELSFAMLSAGVYLLRFSGNGATITRRLIIY